MAYIVDVNRLIVFHHPPGDALPTGQAFSAQWDRFIRLADHENEFAALLVLEQHRANGGPQSLAGQVHGLAQHRIQFERRDGGLADSVQHRQARRLSLAGLVKLGVADRLPDAVHRCVDQRFVLLDKRALDGCAPEGEDDGKLVFAPGGRRQTIIPTTDGVGLGDGEQVVAGDASQGPLRQSAQELLQLMGAFIVVGRLAPPIIWGEQVDGPVLGGRGE